MRDGKKDAPDKVEEEEESDTDDLGTEELGGHRVSKGAFRLYADRFQYHYSNRLK
jgi:hypothetical protein